MTSSLYRPSWVPGTIITRQGETIAIITKITEDTVYTLSLMTGFHIGNHVAELQIFGYERLGVTDPEEWVR